ncbi:16795_t:CDS:2 [Rhizophagus irregularis]|nr:16795_t:CDS:2 [Rhizophagus irregularis]
MELPLEKLLELAYRGQIDESGNGFDKDIQNDTGELKEFNKTAKWRNTTTSRSHGLRMEREQYEGMPECFASSSRRH